jgi:hypothetical protein
MHRSQIGIWGRGSRVFAKNHMQKTIHSHSDDQTAQNDRCIRKSDVLRTYATAQANDFRKRGCTEPRMSDIDGNWALDPMERIVQCGLHARIEVAAQTDEQYVPLS